MDNQQSTNGFKIPPHSQEAETMLLGFLLIDDENGYVAYEQLTPDDFYFSVHKDIFRACAMLYARKEPVNQMSVLLALLENKKNEGRVEEFKQKLVHLVDTLFRAYDLSTCTNKIKELSVSRKLITLTQLINQQVHQVNPDPIADIIQHTVEELFKLSDRLKPSSVGLKPLSDAIESTLEDIDKLNSDQDPDILYTGLYDFDEITGGIQKGTVTVIAGRPGNGKSSVALEFGLNMAIAGKKVAYFSLEMDDPQVTKKLLARLSVGNNAKSPFTVSSMFKPQGLVGLEEYLAVGVSRGTPLTFWIDDYSSTDVARVRGELTKFIRENGTPDAVFIDYVGIMSIPKSGTRALEIDNTLKELRAIAKDFHVAIFALAQINRGVEARQDKRPGLSDIRESGAYEQEAALVVGLYNPVAAGEENAESVIEMIVLKNRFGKTGKATVGFEPQYNRLLNLA